MTKELVGGFKVGLIAVALGASGCGGGGIDEGIPQDASTAKPVIMPSKMGPPPKKMPTPGEVPEGSPEPAKSGALFGPGHSAMGQELA